MDHAFEENIVQFSQKVQERRKIFKEKALRGIDSKELMDYYNRIIRESIYHFSFLQKYITEEFLGETVIECFAMGMEASRHCLSGKELEEIEQIYDQEISGKLVQLIGTHEIHQYLREWDAYSVTMLAEDLCGKWFRKGIQYGEKQRKMRLI
jgi:hypothetical protein